MKLIDHPHVMKLYDVWDTPNELYLILEHVQGGELFDYLCQHGKLPIPEALRYFHQIIAAVDHCHRFNIAHRDLKPENILLDEFSNVKVADFGMAAWQADTLLRTSCGSPHYASPEVINDQEYDGAAADIWSCGVILYALLAGKLPFDADDPSEVLLKVKKGFFTIPSDVDSRAQSLIRRMLTKDVKRRINMEGIRDHPFFKMIPYQVVPVVTPTLEELARPVHVGNIDKELFQSLRILWPTSEDEDLKRKLTNAERNWHKAVYYLLSQYRCRSLEAAEDEASLTHRRGDQQSKRNEDQTRLTPSPSSMPPRTDPPTPRRASTAGGIISAASINSLPDYDVVSPADALQPLMIPNHEDPTIRAFYTQIADHITVLHARTGSPSPMTMMTEMLLDANVPTTLEHNSARSPVIGLGLLNTRPLSVRSKAGRDDTKGGKENKSPVMSKKSSLKKSSNMASSDKKVTIIEPRRFSAKLSRRISINSQSSSSSASSQAGTAHTPKRWLTGLFKFKSSQYILTSVHDASTTRNECRRLLMDMDIRVIFNENEHLGILKCRLDEVVRSSDEGVSSKGVKFRVELHADHERSLIKLVLLHEKGSAEILRRVYLKLRRQWTMDDENCPTPEAVMMFSPISTSHGRFVNV